jgi:rod shape-determining protein MreC
MGGILPPVERRTSALVALWVALSLILLLVGDRIPQSFLRGLGAELFKPMDRVVLVSDRLAAAWRENQQLHERVTELELENLRLRDAARENARLREAFDLPGAPGLRLQPVELLSMSGDPIPSSATLGGGRNRGVRVGDVVVTREGLVGRVTEVYPSTARVTLLTDPLLSVACEVETTGVLGVVRFSPGPPPELRFTSVPFTDTVRVGERIVTSSLSRRYPRGIPVGTVERLSADPNGLTQAIAIAPAARLSRLRHVFVIPAPPPVVGGAP